MTEEILTLFLMFFIYIVFIRLKYVVNSCNLVSF